MEVQKIIDILYEEYKNSLYTDLKSTNHFTFLIAVVLSARSRDEQVNKITNDLFEYISNPYDILNLGLEKLEIAINKIGLYKNKAKYIMQLSQILIDNNYTNGTIPNSLNDLLELPGVGRKTAYVILNTIFKQDTVAVDTHVFRVSRRIGLSSAKTVSGVERELNKMTVKHKQQLHHILIRHGRLICKSRQPKCNKCPVNALCKKIMYDNTNFTLSDDE